MCCDTADNCGFTQYRGGMDAGRALILDRHTPGAMPDHRPLGAPRLELVRALYVGLGAAIATDVAFAAEAMTKSWGARDVVAGVGYLASLPMLLVIGVGIRRAGGHGWAHAMPASWREYFAVRAVLIVACLGNVLHTAFRSTRQSLGFAAWWSALALLLIVASIRGARRAASGESFRPMNSRE